MKKRRFWPPVLQVPISGMAAEGRCVARHEGQVIFVTGVAPGDVADLRITRQHKNYLEAEATFIHTPSPDRTTPFCQHFGVCGGCKWQHLSYDAQLRHKEQLVDDALRRIGKVVGLPPLLPIIPAEPTRYYRNKLEFSASPNAWLTREQIATGETFDRRVLGFHAPGRFDKIVDIEHCHLQPDPSNALRLRIREYARQEGLTFYDAVEQKGFLRNVIVRTAESTGELMVIVQVTDAEGENLAGLLAMLEAEFPQITALHSVVNSKGNDTFHDLDVPALKGPGYIQERMEDLVYRVGPKSFYQTNARQALRLYQLTREMANIQPDDLVYDLYTGAGTIANFVARQARHVVGIEYVESAIVDARINSEINGITNTTFYAGDMKDVLGDAIFAKHGHPDIVITDPPRAGMHPEVVAALLRAAPRRIVYVSCNPATQARDLELLSVAYQATLGQPVDMFPHTQHVENIVVLERMTIAAE
jgi:23S rRNA (uracil1939-C5)-methyltransferase